MNLIAIISCCCFFAFLLLFLVIFLLKKLKRIKLKNKKISYFPSKLRVNNITFTSETTKNTRDFIEKYVRKLIMVETIEKMKNHNERVNTVVKEQDNNTSILFTNIFVQEQHHHFNHNKDNSLFTNCFEKIFLNLQQPKHTLLNDVISFLSYSQLFLIPLHVTKNLVIGNFERFEGVIKKEVITTFEVKTNNNPTNNFNKEQANTVLSSSKTVLPRINSTNL